MMVSLKSSLLLLVASIGSTYGEDGQSMVLDNRDTCAHRVVNCDPTVDHFETKIEMKHSSTVTRLDYENTHIFLEQSWPTRGPWMKSTTQKVLLVRCGCPIPQVGSDWADANIIHIPVSSMMVQMPNTLSKVYMMGQRSKVTAIESNRWISDATPEIATDIRDGIIRRLDLGPNGVPSTRMTLSFENGYFADDTSGFVVHLKDDNDAILSSTDCIYPTNDAQDPIETVLDRSFNSIPGWVDAGNVWILTAGDAQVEPSTSLSYTMYFDKQLSQGLTLDAEACNAAIDFLWVRDAAPNNRPIYHRLHHLPGGFPDVLITEPRSLGPLADHPKILARQFLDSDPGEATPLGRAELMKLIALLVGSVETGNALFETIETRYNTAKALAAKAQFRPTVMVGKPGTWNEAARNSWMITVGSTYVGAFLKDANVEYRNSDDSVNQAICGSGCGACPSGQSDTRCSVGILDYLELFRNADYWIPAGIGANCWSGSCNFAISADSLLAENTDIYSQFLPMQCGSLIGLDKSLLDGDGSGGNTYWELGRLRPDLVLMDLVTLFHPDLELDETTTTFFRKLDPLTDASVVASCPKTVLPPSPQSNSVHVTSRFVVDLSQAPSDLIGASRFAVLDQFPTAYQLLGSAVSVNEGDIQLAMSNNQDEDALTLAIDVRVRVSGCSDHTCGILVGEKLQGLALDLEASLGLDWISVQADASTSIRLLDSKGDNIPLEALGKDDSEVDIPSISEDEPIVASTPSTTSNSNDDGLAGGAIAGIIVGVVAAFCIAMVVTYNVAYAKGAQKQSQSKEAPQWVDENLS